MEEITGTESKSSQGSSIKYFQKGDIIFTEGEKSRAMFLVKSGSIRLFMKKGNSNIEVDTVKAGQILGELAFLDGNPRSLSGEALTPCELVEISGPTFIETLSKSPEWLKILLKTVVGRLRAANSRLRQLEAANQGIDYHGNPMNGSRRTFYQYISWHDFMKVCSGIQLESLRGGTRTEDWYEIFIQNLETYAHSVFGVPKSKVLCTVEILEQMGLAEKIADQKAKFRDLAFIDRLIRYLIEENRLEPEKRHQVSERSFAIMKMIEPELAKAPADPSSGRATINLTLACQNHIKANPGNKGFRMNELDDLIRVQFLTALKVVSANEVLTTIDPNYFRHHIQCLEAVFAMKNLNTQKSQVA